MGNEKTDGMRKFRQLERVKKELAEIQSEGEERILLIAEYLRQELLNQGYKVMTDFNMEHIDIYKHMGMKIEIRVDSHKVSIGSGRKE